MLAVKAASNSLNPGEPTETEAKRSSYLARKGIAPRMDQLALQPWPIRLSIDTKTVSMVGPVVPSGLSEARHVWADDGSEYIAKGVGFKPRQSRFGPANELIAALIGRELGVPLNEFGLLNHSSGMMFGSRWLPELARSYCSRDDQLNACRNREDVAKIFTFDVYLCNCDRHPCNLMIKYQREARRPHSPMLIANDHDRTLLPGDLVPEDLSDYWGRVPPQQFLRSPVLHRAIRDSDELWTQVDAIENLSDDFIASVVRTVPDEWLSRLHRRLVKDFLMERRKQVRPIVRELVRDSPRLREGVTR